MDPGGMDHYVRDVNPGALGHYVDGVLEGVVPGAESKPLLRGRMAYWDPDKKAVVVEEGSGGSVYTPREGRSYYDDELR